MGNLDVFEFLVLQVCWIANVLLWNFIEH